MTNLPEANVPRLKATGLCHADVEAVKRERWQQPIISSQYRNNAAGSLQFHGRQRLLLGNPRAHTVMKFKSRFFPLK